MRYNIKKKHSTKPERIVYEALKELKIPFRHRWKIGRYEVDFLIGKVAIDIDGHDQSPQRNSDLIEMGYVPVHFSNQEITNDRNLTKKKLHNLLWH